MKPQTSNFAPRIRRLAAIIGIAAAGLLAATAAEAGSRVSWSIGVQGGHGGLYVNGGHRYYGGHGYYGRGWYGPRYYGYRPYYYPYYGAALIAPLVVASLPFGYTTVWVEGNPYYQYDNVYYERVPEGYRVVPPPRDVVMADEPPAETLAEPAPGATPGAAPAPGGAAPVPSYSKPKAATETTRVFAYPRNGQTATQATFDRIECERWASGQTGYNPTQSTDQARGADYYRAVGACLEGRGYTVK